MNLSDINEVEKLLKRHGFAFSKALGQNFLIDDEVCPAMAEAAIPDDSYCAIEIGPGIGVLTVELAKRAKKVVSIELDDRLFPILDETLADYDNIEVLHEDAMKVDMKALIADKFDGAPVAICANLPYYITSPIITGLLEAELPVESITVMVQAEAAERLCAHMGTREAGAVTAAIDYYSEASELFDVPRTSFVPAPKVDSKVIRLTLRDEPVHEVDNTVAFFNMIKAAFTQRRKTILNSLSATTGKSKDELREVFENLNLSATSRIEQLSMEDLVRIYNATK